MQFRRNLVYVVLNFQIHSLAFLPCSHVAYMGLASIDELIVSWCRIMERMDVLETRIAHCTEPITGAWQDSLFKLTIGVREPSNLSLSSNLGHDWSNRHLWRWITVVSFQDLCQGYLKMNINVQCCTLGTHANSDFGILQIGSGYCMRCRCLHIHILS